MSNSIAGSTSSSATKVTVFGVGAVGGYIGGVLTRHGIDVTLVARGERLRALQHKGLSIRSHWGDYQVLPKAMAPEHVGTADILLFCVKLYSNDAAIPALAPMVGTNTTIVTLQNGVSSGAALAAAYGGNRVVEGPLYIAAESPSYGEVVQSGSVARIELGVREPGSGGEGMERLRLAVAVLDQPGIQVAAVENVVAILWSKLVSVGAIGTFSTASRLGLDRILETAHGALLIKRLMHEIADVARSEGVRLPENVVEERFAEEATEARFYRASMLADLRAGRPLELDWLLGDVVRRATNNGVDAPVATTLITMLSGFRKGT